MNFYEVLGVDRKAKLADIKRAYRKLARKHHPDLNPGDRRAGERFKQITDAYDVLSDTQKRRAYDVQLDLGDVQRGASGQSPWGTHPESVFDLGDLGGLGNVSSIFSEILGGRGRGADRNAPTRGQDRMHSLRIGFFEALRGKITDITIDAESPCPRCGGAGTIPSRVRRQCGDCAGTGRISHMNGLLRFASTCRRCNGEGMISSEGCGNCRGAGILTRRETVRVHIPAGVDTGSRVRVAGKGGAGRNGGAPGDLYIITDVEPHPFFKRIGDNIHTTVPITVSEAALGTRIEVPTIHGRASIKIPPGTQSGQKFRLRGKGAPSLRGSAQGDAYVEVRIATPRAADERSRELLRELAKLDPGEEARRGLLA